MTNLKGIKIYDDSEITDWNDPRCYWTEFWKLSPNHWRREYGASSDPELCPCCGEYVHGGCWNEETEEYECGGYAIFSDEEIAEILSQADPKCVEYTYINA